MAYNKDITVYGINTPKQASYDIKSKGDKRYGFSFPLMNRGGGYLKKATGIELIKNNLRQLLLTNRGERVMLPDFGTNIRQYLMEPLDQALLSQIKREILESVTKYATNVKLTKLLILPSDSVSNSGGNHIYIKAYFQIPEEQDINFEVKVELF